MEKLKRRTAIKSLGALSLGIAVPSLSKAEKLVTPYETQEKSIVTDILVVGGGTAGTIAVAGDNAGSQTFACDLSRLHKYVRATSFATNDVGSVAVTLVAPMKSE